MKTERYMLTHLENGDVVIADTKDMGNPWLYMLTMSFDTNPADGVWWNTEIRLGQFDVRNFANKEEPVHIETPIWVCDAWLRRQSAAESMVKMILASLESEEVEIKHPHELAFRYGGQIVVTP